MHNPSITELFEQFKEDLKLFPTEMAPHLVFIYLCHAESLGREVLLRELREQNLLKDN